MASTLEKATPEELGRLFPIILSEPKKEWRGLFLEEKSRLIALLGQTTAIRVEHMGSTAIPGMIAKPTIDILVEIPDKKTVEARIVTILTPLGYIRMAEQTTHLMMVKGYTPEGIRDQSYHIHFGPKHLNYLWDRLAFRDYLMTHPAKAEAYIELKRELAEKFPFDREAYTAAKGAFIARVTQAALEEKARKR